MLDTAENLLREILITLKPWIEAGVPVIGLEPSCVAVFRDELINLFPHDEDARRLNRQTFLLSEFLNKKVQNYQPPRLERKALVHGHCHHTAVMKMTDEEQLLHKLGLDFRILDSGCCGMAGSFGFEREHYDVSLAVGELILLPAVREAPKDELIVANGFSCREQIGQTTDRRALHLAEVIQMALRQGRHGPAGEYPERDRSAGQNGQPAGSLGRMAVLLGAGALLGGLLWWTLSKRRGYEGQTLARSR
jgi:Fe-S oxidoreductase